MESTEEQLINVLQKLAIARCKILNLENSKAVQPKNASAAAPASQKSIPKKNGFDFFKAQGIVLSHNEAYCNTCGCKVPLTADNIMEHIDGARHKSVCPNSDPANTVSSSSFCIFCNKALKNPFAMRRHLTQESHLDARWQSIAEAVDAQKISPEEFIEDLLHINKIEVMQTYKHCTICDKNFSKGTNDILHHVIDPMHRHLFPDIDAYLDAQNIVEDVDGETYKCILCIMPGMGIDEAMNHCAELDHFDRILNIVQNSPAASQAPTTSRAPNKTKEKEINIENIEFFNRVISKPTKKYCTVCDVVFPGGIYNIIMHVNGFKHKKAFNWKDEYLVYFLSVQGVARNANDNFTCNFCNIAVISDLDALEHCKTTEHALQIRDCHWTFQ